MVTASSCGQVVHPCRPHGVWLFWTLGSVCWPWNRQGSHPRGTPPTTALGHAAGFTEGRGLPCYGGGEHRQQEGSGPRVAGLRAQWHVSLGWSTTSSDLAAGQTAPACGFPAFLCSGLRFRAGSLPPLGTRQAVLLRGMHCGCGHSPRSETLSTVCDAAPAPGGRCTGPDPSACGPHQLPATVLTRPPALPALQARR